MRPAILTSKISIFSSSKSNDNDIDMKWPVLQLCGQRDQLKTKFHFFCSYPNRSGNFIIKITGELIADRNVMLHFKRISRCRRCLPWLRKEGLEPNNFHQLNMIG